MLEKNDNTKENKEPGRTNNDRERTLFLRTLAPLSSETPHQRGFEYHIEDTTILDHFRSAEQKKSGEKLSIDAIKRAIDDIRKENYGVIDLNNDEHVELLYCYISQRAKQRLRDSSSPSQKQGIENEPEKWQREKLMSPDAQNTYRTAYLGGGFSTASEIESQGIENEPEKWQREKLMSPDAQNTYRTAYLGGGFSTASEIESRGKTFDHRDSILIGLPQPWGGKRGPGVIGHPEHMITPKRQFSQGTKIDDVWMNREDLSQQIEEVFQDAKIKRVTAQVTELKKVDRFWRITYGKNGNEQTIYAKEVIFGLGPGDHLLPDGIDETEVAKTPEEALSKEKRIMNMDIFTHVSHGLEKAERRKETVIIAVGGMGLSVTVVNALQKGYQVEWVTGKNGAAFLPGQPAHAAYLPYLRHLSGTEKNPVQKKLYDQKIKEFEENHILEHLFHGQDEEIFEGFAEALKEKEYNNVYLEHLKSAKQTKSDVTVRLQNGEEVKGDYVVYAMGPDLSAFELLDETIRTNLVPTYDLNQRFPQPENETEPTVLGLRTKDDATGSSLKIIGAAAHRMARSMKMEEKMKNVIESLPSNVPLNDVLTPIRSQIEADPDHSFMPYDVNQHVNFLTDDRTMLAVHISAKYPVIADYQSPVSAQGKETDTASSGSLVGILAKMIVRSRRQKSIKIKTGSLSLDGPDVLAVPPHGQEFQETWGKALSQLEEYLQQNKQEG